MNSKLFVNNFDAFVCVCSGVPNSIQSVKMNKDVEINSLL